MTQRDLNRNVTRDSGETVTEIANRGFTQPESLPAEPVAEDIIVDWDRAQDEHNVALFLRSELAAVA